MADGVSISPADLRAVVARLSAVSTKVLPEASRLALNDVAFKVFFENKNLIERSFDRPVAFTRNAFRVDKATPSNLVATVERKTIQSGRHYLEVQSEGGRRPQTGLEKLLASRLRYEGIIQSVLPTANMRRTAAGNMSRGLVNQIVSAVQAQRDPTTNTTAASRQRNRRRAQYFVPGVDSKLSPGVYERRGKSIRKMLAFSDKSPSYEAAFPMQEHAQKVAEDAIEPAFERAFRTALART
ncbi:hypothetical protein [Yoonia sp. 208BN28-4]|uniref:hypothetical protein n=1 Tax=Yoonia sp. 208BN28-4 TaxID=3126505 RepID=UPI0030AE335E